MLLTASRRLLATHISKPRISTRPSVVPTPTLFKIGAAFSTRIDEATMGAVKDFVEKEIKNNDVLIFSKSYCPVSVVWLHLNNEGEAERGQVQLWGA